MIPIPSVIDGQSFLLQELEQVMKPLGYVINGGWEYNHGCPDRNAVYAEAGVSDGS